jgi:N-sulfoglucosamine sulfohydrolase
MPRSIHLLMLCVLLIGLRAPAQERPNILLCIADDQGYPHASAYGCRFVSTPHFDRIAREGILFTHCFSASPGCAPSRASLLTGRPTWQLREGGTHASSFPRDLKVYPELLAKSGYVTGMTGKGWGPGNFKITGWEHNPAGPPAPKSGKENGIQRSPYGRDFAAFLDARPKEKPFCFWFGSHEPHRPYAKGAGLRSGKKLEDVDLPSYLPDLPEVRSDLLDYATEIDAFDTQVGEMIALLEAHGELEHTLIVVTSDNGLPFPRAKANAYDAGVRVPLAVRWPGHVPSARTVDDLVSLTDLAPTFLAAAGVEIPAEMVGRNLLPLFQSERFGVVDPDHQEVWFARERHSSSRPNNATYPQRAVRTPDYLYIRNFAPDRWPAGDIGAAIGDNKGFGVYDIDDGPTLRAMYAHRDDDKVGPLWKLATDRRPAEEFFDVNSDPDDLRNLADDRARVKELEALRKRVDEHLKATGDPRVGDNPDVWEGYPRYSPIRYFPGEKVPIGKSKAEGD